MVKLVKTVFCIAALSVLLLIGILGVQNIYDHERGHRVLEGAAEADNALNDSLPRTEILLAPYRMANALLGTRFFPDDCIYILPNGHITKTQWEHDPSDTVEATVELARYCEEHGINFEYIVFPAKPVLDSDLQDPGVGCSRNANADEFVAQLRQQGVICHDMREIPYFDRYEMFYKTDHHWTVDAGFAATYQIADWLNQDFGYSFDLERLDSSRFTRTVYPDCFVGELGRATLGPFGTIEDFAVITPAYDVNLHYTSPQQGIDRTGGFDIIFDDMYFENIDGLSDHNRYYYYLGGNYNEVELTDYDVEEGDILIIKDSFSMVTAPFLSLVCNHLTLWDMREDTHIYEYLEQHPEIETVVIMYNAGSCANMDYHDFQ